MPSEPNTTDLVAQLRVGEMCVPPCRMMEARSGCLCAAAADEIERLRHREAHLLEVIRCYNSDDGLFDHEKVLSDVSLPKLCEDCRKNWADWPSKLCPGCEAYREHTGAL